MINAKVRMRHDYLEIPKEDPPPIMIEGRRYVGNRKWKLSGPRMP